MKLLAAIGAAVLVVPVVVVVATALGLWGSYACHLLWTWHAIPRGLPTISTTEFFVASSVLSLFRGSYIKSVKKDKDEDEYAWLRIGLAGLIAPALALLVGWWLR